MCGQKFGRKLVKPLRIEKTGMGKRKPKVDNARRMRGIYFIDPDDEEYEEILKNARRKLERPVASTMPCKRQSSITKVVAKPKIASVQNSKTMYFHGMWHRDELVHQVVMRHRSGSFACTVIFMVFGLRGIMTLSRGIMRFHSTTVPDAKEAVDKEWKKLETIPAWDLEIVKGKKEVILEAQRDKEKVHFATLMDICHL